MERVLENADISILSNFLAILFPIFFLNIEKFCQILSTRQVSDQLTIQTEITQGAVSALPQNQAFYGLKHYNLLETGSFLIRKLNQSTSCLMLQFKGKNTLKLPFDSNFK